MWEWDPRVRTIATVPVGALKFPIAVHVECAPQLPLPAYPAASFTVWTENESGAKVNMPFVAQVSQKQPWVLFNIPYVPPGTREVRVKAKGFPIAFVVKQVRVQESVDSPAKDPLPPDWTPPKTPIENIQEGIGGIGRGATFGIILLVVIIIVVLVMLPEIVDSIGKTAGPVIGAAGKAALL